MKKTLKIIIIILIAFTLGTNNIKAEELPKIFLEGNIEDMQNKKEERQIKLRYISNNLEFTSYIKIKLQGNSSIRYDKKNYTIKLYKDKKYKEKKDVNFGWGAQHKYTLKANWIDKTHSRNIVTANIVASIQNKYNLFINTPNNGEIDGFPVEVYLNDNFLGLYTWNIPKDNWTYNMDKDNSNHIVMAANEKNNATLFQEEATLENWEVEIGPETEKTLEKFNRLVNFIKDSSDQEFQKNFEKYLDLDATLNYYCILQYANLEDNITKNLLLSTYNGKIWYPILYDLDTSWGTNWKGTETTNYTHDLTNNLNSSLLWKKLNKNFPNEIANRYFELRKTILTKENILKEFNKFYQKIPSETLTKEKEKWQEIPGFDISQIAEFIDTRTPVIDKQMYNLYNNTPTINIEYSTKNPTLKPITVNLNTNRNDIIIIKNHKKSYDYKYTFTENGEYTYEYQDWYGNYLGSITISIDNIYTKQVKIILLIIIIVSIIATLHITSKNKKETTSNIPPKTTPKKNNSPKKKDNFKKSTSTKTTSTKTTPPKKSTSTKTTTSKKNNSPKKKNTTKNKTQKKSINK